MQVFRKSKVSSGAEVGEAPAAPAGMRPYDLSATAIRPMKIEDSHFIFDSWARSYMHSPDVAGMDSELFKVEHRDFMYNLIRSVTVLMIVDAAFPDNIRGWVCAEKPREVSGLWIIHYVLVKPEFQGHGYATALLAPFKKVSPNGLLWAACKTHALKHFATDYLMYNKYIYQRTQAREKRANFKGPGK